MLKKIHKENDAKQSVEQDVTTTSDDMEFAAECKEQDGQIDPEPGEAEFSGGEEPAVATETKIPELVALEEEKKNLIERLSRLQADFDNFRRRANQERDELKEWVEGDVLTRLLPVLDNFERALSAGQNEGESFAKGVEMIYRQILGVLEKSGVTVMDAEGQPFDPHLHHAVMKETAPEGVAEDTVIAVLQKGYLMKDRVLRPAMVKVAE